MPVSLALPMMVHHIVLGYVRCKNLWYQLPRAPFTEAYFFGNLVSQALAKHPILTKTAGISEQLALAHEVEVRVGIKEF